MLVTMVPKIDHHHNIIIIYYNAYCFFLFSITMVEIKSHYLIISIGIL